MIKKFPRALQFFCKFLALKSDFKNQGGPICLYSYIVAVNEFGKNWRGYLIQNFLSLELLDLCEALGRMDKKDNIKKAFF
jgi:hypothetical protein